MISRSQAKRILRGLEQFKTIRLDFKKVDIVGQGFVDEIFRVFIRQYPHIKIEFCNANSDVQFMIERGIPKR
ncbi:MAG: STAS-like domain-containing protein [Gammaproteobacteria bacterium]|nr:STAS-like domain-containing protein [Gammaproteobacteria bacterium]